MGLSAGSPELLWSTQGESVNCQGKTTCCPSKTGLSSRGIDESRRFDLRGTLPALGAFRQSVGEVKNFSDLTLLRHVISIFTHFDTYTPAALFASRVSWG